MRQDGNKDISSNSLFNTSIIYGADCFSRTDIHSGPYIRNIHARDRIYGFRICPLMPAPHFSRRHHYPDSNGCRHIVKGKKKPSVSY